MKTNKPVTIGNSKLRCHLDLVRDLVRLEPAGGYAWECRLIGDLRAAPQPDDSKWEYPRTYKPGWTTGTSKIESFQHRGELAADLEVCSPTGPVKLSVAVDPERPAVRFAIEAHPDTPAPLSWPGPLRPAQDPGGNAPRQLLYLPYCQGFVFAPGKAESRQPLAMQVRCGPGLSLPVAALTVGTAGWLLTFETPDDAAIEIAKESGHSIEVRPIWLSSMGALRYRRSLRYEFASPASGTCLAKLHRTEVVGSPTWKTLRQKMEERPLVGKLAGAPYVYTGYYQFEDFDRRLTEMCRRLIKEAGYRSFLVGPLSMCGHRDRTMTFLGDAQRKEKCIDAPGTRQFLSSRGLLHTNWVLDKLADVRLEGFDASHFLLQADGSRWMSWVTEDQKLAELCPLRVDVACAPVFDRWCEGAPAHAMDTTAMTGLVECHHPEHPCTRAQDRQARIRHLERFLARGHVIASEAGQDWAVPVADVLSLGNLGLHITNSRTGWRPVPFPFFALVYRECVGSVWHEADTWHDERAEDKVLCDAAVATVPTLAPLLRLFKLKDGRPVVEGQEYFTRDQTSGRGWELCKRGVKLARLHAETWLEEMTSFEYLDGECLLSRTELAGGTAVLVNRSSDPAEIDGRVIPARSYATAR